MSASVIGSEFTLLLLIRQLSILLALAALGILLLLMLRRIYQEQRQKTQERRGTLLLKRIYALMDTDVPLNREVLPLLSSSDLPLIMDLMLPMIRSMRGETVTRLIAMLEAWHFLPYFHHLLKKGNRAEKIKVLTLLAHFSSADTLLMLFNTAKTETGYIQLAALRGLAIRQAYHYLPDILSILLTAKQRNSLMLTDVLLRFGEEATPFFIRLATGEAETAVRIAALKALAGSSAPEVIPTLLLLAEDEEHSIRAESLKALAKIGDLRARTVIRKRLNDLSEMVRKEAAYAAGSLALEETLEPLSHLLRDPCWWVRYNAAQSLIRLGSPGVTLLMTHLHNPDEAGHIARQVLAEKRGEYA